MSGAIRSAVNALFSVAAAYLPGTIGQRLKDFSDATNVANGAGLIGHENSTVGTELRDAKADRHLYSSLKKSYKKLAAIAGGATSQFGLLTMGDSIASYPARGLNARLNNAIDVAGYALDTVGNSAAPSSINNTTAGDVVATGGAVWDSTFWPSGSHLDVGVGGTIVSTVGGVAFTGTYFAFYYVKRSGGGTMTVDLLDAANAVISTMTVDTNNASTALGIASFTVSAAARKIRLTGLTGRCIHVGTAMINRSVGGVVYIGLAKGGLSLTDMNAAPTAIWQGVMTDLQPDLATYSMRESAALVASDLTTLLNKFTTAYAATEWVLFGVYPWGASTGQGDFGLAKTAQPSFLENEAVRSVARSTGYGFFDAYAVLPSPSKLDTPSDVHLSSQETDFLTSHFIAQLGIDYLLTVASQFTDVYTPKVVTTQLDVSGSRGRNFTQKALKITGANDLDASLSYFRTIFLKDQSGLTALTATSSTGGNGLGLSYQAYTQPANAYNSAAAYGTDGTWLKAWYYGKLETRLRSSSSIVSRRVDPMYALGAALGGSPLQLFATTDAAFTTQSDYASGELRVAHDVAGSRLVFQLQPVGGGGIKVGYVAVA